MNKKELIESIQAKTGEKVTRADISSILSATTESIMEAVKKEEDVTLVGFGSFKPTKRAARMGRNPQTGETLQIKASNSVRFKVGSDFKSYVN